MSEDSNIEEFIQKICNQTGVQREMIAEKAAAYDGQFQNPEEREKALENMLSFLQETMAKYEQQKELMSVEQSASFLQGWTTGFEIYSLAKQIHENAKEQ